MSQMAVGLSRLFPARAEALPDVCAFIEAGGATMAVPAEVILRLQLIAEELFINTATHGYAGHVPGTVCLSLREIGDEIELVAEDDAPAFNPFEDLPSVPAVADPGARRVGGLGRALVAAICCRHSYLRQGSKNRVTVALHRQPR